MCGGPLASENSVKVKLSQIMAGGDFMASEDSGREKNHLILSILISPQTVG